MRKRLELTRRAASILLSLSACGGEDGPKAAVRPRDSGMDVDRDARADADAASDAAVGVDSGSGSDEDAGPRKPPFDPLMDCKVVAERSERSVPVTFGDESGFTLTPGLTGFGVAYQSGTCTGALSMLSVASVGEYAQASELYTDCDTVAQGVSLLHVSGGYRLVWVDNFTGSGELQALQLGDALTPPASTVRTTLSNNQLRELTPLQASIAGSDFLSWVALDTVTKRRDVMLRRVDTQSEARTLVAADAGYLPIKLALAQLGQDSGALAFVSEQGNVGIWLVPLNAQGEARRAPIQITAAISSGNTVDLATRTEDGGAVVYSTDIDGRREVRFRRLNPQGEFLSDEVKVVTQPLQGRDASITRLGGGYVVAFRSFGEDAAERGEIRLAFVTKEGNLQRDSAGRVLTYLVSQASTTGGRVTARISQDGHLLVGFVDTAAEGATGPQFRLVRKRLDCAL
jgi:hypothetical protein